MSVDSAPVPRRLLDESPSTNPAGLPLDFGIRRAPNPGHRPGERRRAQAGRPELPPLGRAGVVPRLSERHAREYFGWKPQLLPLLLTFAGWLALSVWFYQPDRSWFGWVLTVLWALPALQTLIGLQGALMLRRRVRAMPHRVPPPAPADMDTLITVVPTIGRRDTYPALERSVLSYCAHLPVYFADVRVDVVIEAGCEAAGAIHRLARGHRQVRVVTVPRDYTTPNGTRFKARANHFAHELRIAEGEARDDVWVLHMDDDTGVGPDTAAAISLFIDAQRKAGPAAKHLAQGILTYPRENAANRLTWFADAKRPADDFAVFCALTGTGTPVAGVHGELLLIRASIEAGIGWDFGPKTIVEDAQFALTFCGRHPGRSDWFNGRCYGASPATVGDFLKQRERWSWGLVALAWDRSIPFRHRAFLAWSVFTWTLGPLQHLGVVLLTAWLIGDLRTAPVTQSVLVLWALNFGYAIWVYWEGLRLNAMSSRNRRRLWYEPIVVTALLPVLALLEGVGFLRGIWKWVRRREKAFVVIAKPV